MTEKNLELGQKVQDQISGFAGIVTLIGEHISGCERIGVYSVGEEHSDRRGEQEFFYGEQLDVLEAETEFTERMNPRTESEVGVGDLVNDKVTGLGGVAVVINYKLFNCPSVCVQPSGDSQTENPDSKWVDDVRLTVRSSHNYSFDGLNDATTEETGSVGRDRSPRDYSR